MKRKPAKPVRRKPKKKPAPTSPVYNLDELDKLLEPIGKELPPIPSSPFFNAAPEKVERSYFWPVLMFFATVIFVVVGSMFVGQALARTNALLVRFSADDMQSVRYSQLQQAEQCRKERELWKIVANKDFVVSSVDIAAAKLQRANGLSSKVDDLFAQGVKTERDAATAVAAKLGKLCQ